MAEHKRGKEGSEAQRTARGQTEGSVDQPVSAAELASSLGGMDFPARRNDLEQWARDHHARDQVIQNIHNMPDREYGSMADVEHGFSEVKRK